jgi:curved DNA-binding protein CbpA
MDIQHCYEILELNADASIEDVKQAYRDLVNIWHPDRVSNNPRLKQKAEEKLKQINTAHERLLSHLNSRQKQPAAVDKAPRTESARENPYQDARTFTQQADRSETPVKTGSGIVSTLWSHLSNLLHRLSETHLSPREGMGGEPYSPRPKPEYRQDRGMGGGTGEGRGKGMGRGGRGMGRGKAMGRGKGRR